MDCRRFRENHFAFVDDTLPGIELVGMQVHLTECGSCANHDAMVRRSLMLFRSLPSIEPSADFSFRLEQKLRNVRLSDTSAPYTGRARRLAATVAVSSVVMLGYIGVSLRELDSPQDITLPPVVALADSPESSEPSVSSPASEVAAVVPAGLPIWTAALLADQSSAHFASFEFASASR